MIGLGALEQALVNDGRFDLLDDTHLHRAWLEDDFGVTLSRDAIRERRVSRARLGRAPVTILADLGDMIAFDDGEGWRGHRWVQREDRRILGEIEIVDRAHPAALAGATLDTAAAALGQAHPIHAPLGELRPGRGQLGTDRDPVLPAGWPEGARDAATRLHRAWNGRALGVLETNDWRGPADMRGDADMQRRWMLAILTALPDAMLLFERAIVGEGQIALLWRLHGHHLGPGLGGTPAGRRVRALGSSLLTMAGTEVAVEETMIDLLALRAQPHRPVIDDASAAAAD